MNSISINHPQFANLSTFPSFFSICQQHSSFVEQDHTAVWQGVEELSEGLEGSVSLVFGARGSALPAVVELTADTQA